MYKIIFLLLLAAFLEVLGDALISHALHHLKGWARLALCVGGGGILFLYGMMVNLSSWDFGRVLGIYIVFFFIIAQILSCLMTRSFPSFAIVLAGLFIVIGGIILTLKA